MAGGEERRVCAAERGEASELEIMLGDAVFRAAAGAFAFAPRGTLHCFRNVLDVPSRVLVMFTPGGFEGFFFEAGLPAVEGETPSRLGPERSSAAVTPPCGTGWRCAGRRPGCSRADRAAPARGITTAGDLP
jgi:hypothetical protein